VTRLAKLTRPKLHQVVPRERLFERLDAARTRPLVWVCGPPGAGKTSMVASYLDARKLRGWWYQVDPGDADLGTFFHYLGMAADGARAQRTPLPVLAPQHYADLPAFARLYSRALFARLKPPAALVLDNYHELPGDAALHLLLEPIARELPEGIGVIVTSRTPPPPTCAGLRALDRIAFLDWDELRLTLDETRQIAAARTALDEPALRTVHDLVGGWPVGLVLVLEQMRRAGADAAAVEQHEREVLFDYFAGQIFATLPGESQRVLMLAALLPRASAAQAERLAGDAEAAKVLDALYRRRLFVDRRGEMYQFHDLFRAFLLQQFDATFEPASARQWRAQASRLLAGDGQVEDAFGLACDAQDWAFASELAIGHAVPLFEQGRLRTLLQWIDRMPPEAIEGAPWLGFWASVAIILRSPAQARAGFEASHARFAAVGDTAAMAMCCGGVLACSYWEYDNLAVLDPWIDRLLDVLATQPVLEPAAELRVQAGLLFGLSLRRPDPAALDACVARMEALLVAPGMPVNARIHAASHLMVFACDRGDFAQMERLLALVDPWRSEPDVGPVFPPLWWLQVGHYHAALGDDARAVEAYRLAAEEADRAALPLPMLRVHCQIGMARLALCRGDIEAAEAARAQTAVYWTTARRIDSCIDSGLRGLMAARRGDRVEALARAREQFEQAQAVGTVPLQHASAVQLAGALVDAGDIDAALAVIDEARQAIAGGAYASLAYQLDLLDAYALRERDAGRAQKALAQGLVGSRADAGLFTLRLLPGVLPTLLADALRAGIDIAYVTAIARRFHLRAPTDEVPGWPWPLEIRTFGRFEIRRDGEPLAWSRKTPKKPLALLKAIIALGTGGSVPEQRVLDALWPDEEGDAASNSLAAAVLRLRTLLGDPAAIVQQGGKLSLDRTRVWVDVFAFEQALAAADAATHRRDRAEHAHLARASALYQGAFLVEDEGEGWPVTTRERLRGRFIHALGRHAEHLEAEGDCDAAVLAYLRGLDADPVVESFYQGLMRCYQRLGRRSEAIGAYQRMRQMLSISLGLAPAPDSERLYDALRAG
jgi:ATP/maltotriose-dependent transcriptional regulator MalT/DNA-binding SARP family transcriptional activator